MPQFVLAHRHTPEECAVAFAAWRGFDSPLRHATTLGSCDGGGHELWWTVEADDTDAALALLPPFLAQRTEVTLVTDLPVP